MAVLSTPRPPPRRNRPHRRRGIRTTVRGGTLHISFDHHGIGDPDPVVEASVPGLWGIDASGSGDVSADGIDADAFDVRSHGSADISATGTAGSLRVDMDGSGDANLGDPSLTKHLDGSGDLSQGD